MKDIEIKTTKSEIVITIARSEFEIDTDELLDQIESFIQRAVVKHWQYTKHKPVLPEAKGGAMSSCKLCGLMADREPHFNR